MPAGAVRPLKVIDPTVLKTDHDDYVGMTKPEARRAIKILLDKYNIGITPEVVSKSRAQASILEDNAGELPAKIGGLAIMDGNVFVRAYYDGTNNTGQIKNGKPVVFDTVKGWGVTGIHPDWGVDEYKIVGTALDDYNDLAPNGKKILVKLHKAVPQLESLGFMAKLQGHLAGADSYPSDVWGLVTGGGPFQMPTALADIYSVSVTRDEDGNVTDCRLALIETAATVFNPTPFGYTGFETLGLQTYGVYVRPIGTSKLWMVERPRDLSPGVEIPVKNTSVGYGTMPVGFGSTITAEMAMTGGFMKFGPIADRSFGEIAELIDPSTPLTWWDRINITCPTPRRRFEVTLEGTVHLIYYKGLTGTNEKTATAQFWLQTGDLMQVLWSYSALIQNSTTAVNNVLVLTTHARMEVDLQKDSKLRLFFNGGISFNDSGITGEAYHARNFGTKLFIRPLF